MSYCIHMLSHRMQLLLDEGRYGKVSAEAKRRGVSVAEVIRTAIDRDLAVDMEGRRAAVAAILDAETMPVPADPRELRQELDGAHDRSGL